MSIILITGIKGAGKDTVGQYFVDIGYQRYAFADELKANVARTFSLPLKLFHSRDTKDAAIFNAAGLNWNLSPQLSPQLSPRDLCIKYGDFTRSINPDVWAQHVKKRIVDEQTEPIRAVITDCRYQNEIDVIKDIACNVIVIRVVRDGITSTDACDLQDIKHDFILYNNSTIVDLYTQITQCMINYKI